MIFNRGKREDGLRWDNTPVGVFKAPDPESACKKAAHKAGSLGTYFAVEGYPWGVQMLEVDDVEELGGSELEQAKARLRELERQVDGE